MIESRCTLVILGNNTPRGRERDWMLMSSTADVSGRVVPIPTFSSAYTVCRAAIIQMSSAENTLNAAWEANEFRTGLTVEVEK